MSSLAPISPTNPAQVQLGGTPALAKGKAHGVLIRFLQWALPAAILALLVPRLQYFIQAGVARIGWPWQIDFVEGVNLNITLELAQGHNIYRHNGLDSFLSAPYPPLFYFITAPLSWLAGPSLGPGRTVSLLATVVVAILIAYIVWRVCRLLPAGLLSAGLWLSLSPVIVWSAFDKQDIVALALDLGGLAWAISAVCRDQAKSRRIYVAAIFFMLAFYTKQSALSAAAATSMWLLIRDWRLGLRFIGLLAGLIGVPFLVGNALLSGGLWEHLVMYQSLGQTSRRLLKTLSPLTSEYWPLLLIGGALLAGWLVYLLSNKGRSSVGGAAAKLRSPWAVLVLYTLIGWANTLVTSGTDRSNFNHVLDGLLPTCILVGLAFGYAWTLTDSGNIRGKVLSGAIQALLAVTLLVQVIQMKDPQTWFRGGVLPGPDRNTEMRALSKLVASTPGEIYSEDQYLLLSNGKRPVYDDASTFVPLAQLGLWDDSEFNQSIRDRRFSLIIGSLGSTLWTDAGARALHDSYFLKFPGSIDVYAPKLTPDTPQYTLGCTLSADGDVVLLGGYSLAPAVADNGIARGDILRTALYWQAEGALHHDYATYLHVLDEQGNVVASQDNPHTGASEPTLSWRAKQVVVDMASITIPTSLPGGRYRLLAGMYRQEKQAIMPLSPGCPKDNTYGDGILLGSVEVK